MARRDFKERDTKRPAREDRRPRRDDPRPKPQRREPAAVHSSGGRFVFGVNPVLEAIRAKPDDVERIFVADGHVGEKAASEIFARARAGRIRVDKVPRERLATLADGGVHQGVVAELKEFKYAEIEDILEAAHHANEDPLVVVLDSIQDPHNLGAIIRSAHALGAHGVVVPKDRAVSVTGVVAKASAGAVEHCKVARVTNLSRTLEELKEAGLWSVAADPRGNVELADGKLTGPIALVVGAEGEGIREGVLSHCDFRLRIPMKGQVASLNASVSASVMLYEVARQRSRAKQS